PLESTAVSHALSGIFAIASSSASVIFHPTVKRTVLRLVFSFSRCSRRAWVAPAPSILTRLLAREEPGTWSRTEVSTLMWSLAVLAPALPGHSMARHSPVLAHQAARGCGTRSWT